MSKERYERRIQLAQETGAPFGVGSYTQGIILIVGEQASNPEDAPEQQPFCTTKGCSGWLNKMLEIESIPEEALFWVNALNNDSTNIDLQKLVDELKPTCVLALGSVADQVCTEQGVTHEKIYHPQYWKRFRSKERYPLLDRLKQLTDL